MNKPDLLICWIKHCDYPLFRRFLREHRDLFDKVIIYWSEHFRHMYFNKFIEDSLADLNIIFLQNIDYQYGIEDWRNVATNLMLKHSDSEWVCSIEQDFFASDWKKVLGLTGKAMETNDLVGWGAKSGIKQFYIHPAYWFIKRSILDQTSKDFAAHDGEDHFGHITRDVEKLGGKIFSIERDGKLKCDVSADSDCFHQGGINQNYLQALEPGYIFHRPEWFYIYNWWSMELQIPQNKEFMELMKKVDSLLKVEFPDIDPVSDIRNKFYI